MMDLKTYIAQHGLTYRQMGELLDPRRPAQTVYRWATGQRLPRKREDFEAISKATGGEVTAETFFAPSP